MSQKKYVTEKEVSGMPNSKKQIMTPVHPRWGEFIERLSGTEGCDLKYDDKKKTKTWRCENDYQSAIKILKTIQNIDIEGSLRYFQKKRGYCDCEIVSNITS